LILEGVENSIKNIRLTPCFNLPCSADRHGGLKRRFLSPTPTISQSGIVGVGWNFYRFHSKLKIGVNLMFFNEYDFLKQNHMTKQLLNSGK